LEFKSTLQWDIRENRKNEGLQQSCLKTIAAFLNTAGGVLLIGAQDDGTVLGLESDLQCMNNGSLDKFERHLMQLIENRIGKQFLLFIKIRFNHSNEKDICGVYVKQSSKKAFLKSEKGLELYVRTGNATKSLTVPEIYEFL
jgi:predicted HTH transcriptional regulator